MTTTTPTPRKARPPSRFGEWVRKNSLVLFLVLIILQTAVNGAMTYRSDRASDDAVTASTAANSAVAALELAVATEGARACDRANASRTDANEQVMASAAIARAVALNSDVGDVIVAAFLAAFRALSPDGQLDPAAEDAAQAVIDTVSAATTAVDEQLAIAEVSLATAIRELRDCPNIDRDPDATLPPPTLPPIFPVDPTTAVPTEVDG